jgi:hypothetical protein
MRIREVKNSMLAKVLGVGAITLYPFIFYSDKAPSNSIRFHEGVHCHQIQTLGWFRFYSDYLWQYVKLRLKGFGHGSAYYNISYEVEAYGKQSKFDTLTVNNSRLEFLMELGRNIILMK